MSEAKVRVRVAHNAMHLPVVALRGLVVFPNNVVHFEVGRQKSIAAIEAAGFDARIRPEALTLEDFAKIQQALG